MKLRTLEIENFRKFIQPLRISGLDDGLNLICGPNEFGKSTLLEALYGVLFEKHRSKAEKIQSMRPAGHSTAPTIRLQFELAGQSYTIAKRFLAREPIARLTLPDGRVLEGDPAEEGLQALLHFGAPGVKGAGPETLGIWGLLWVRQAASFVLPVLQERAVNTLHESLQAEIGLVTSGRRGAALLAVIEAKLGELVDARGRPRQRYARVIADLEALSAQLAEWRQLQQEMTENISRLHTQRGALDRLLQDAATEEDQRALDAARGQRDMILGLRHQIATAEIQAQLARDRLISADAAIQARRALYADDLAAARAAAAALRHQAECQATAAAASTRLRQDRQILEAAEAALEQAEARPRRLRLEIEAATQTRLLAEIQQRLQQAIATETRVNLLAGRAAALRVDPPALAALQRMAEAVTKADARIDANATEIEFDLTDSAAIRLDGRALTAAETRVKTVSPLVLEIAGMGRITIRPGLDKAETLLAQQRQAQAQLRQELDALGVASLEAARQHCDEKQRLSHELASARRELMLLVDPDRRGETQQVSPQPLALKQAKLAAELAQLRLRLGSDAVPSRSETLPQHLAAAEAAVEAAEAGVKAARAALAGPEQDAAKAERAALLAQQAYRQAQDQADLIRHRLAEAEAASGQVALDSGRAEAAVTALVAEEQVAALKARDGVPLDMIDSRIERLERKINQRRTEIQNLKQSIQRLEATIEFHQATGLEERIQRGLRSEAELERERAKGQREQACLTLLRDTLTQTEQAAREKFTGPILKRIQPYLRTLFPDSDIRVDEQLEIAGITRAGQTEEAFGRLSDGTREQIAILTRLGLAELLVEQKRPAAVIFDDALVFSDDARLEQMFDILNFAARKTQIIVLSCRQRQFEGLAGHRPVLETLSQPLVL